MKNRRLTGQRFGKLLVLEDSGRRQGSSVLWRCRCDCGNEILLPGYRLTSGCVRDCGCVPKPKSKPVTDLIGRQFGNLTVVRDSGERSQGSILWECRCGCGGEVLATRRELVSGNAASCGCIPRQYASRRHVEELTGQTFGRLTVIRRAENSDKGQIRWVCRCACGKETTTAAADLKSGHVRSCGCGRHGRAYNRRDLTGQRFGRLTVICPSDSMYDSKKAAWHCRCDCGKEVDVAAWSLLRGLTSSCGCLNRERSAKMHEHMDYRNGTCAEVLARACTDAGECKNKAGFRGLFRTESGKYRASITFQGKHYTLGYYGRISDAVQARLDAEESLHAGYLKALDRYEKKAEAHPAWAEKNPFYYRAERRDGEFHIETNA